MSVTIRDVAKLAGVSASTVSRVINKSAPISEETTGRIYRAMEELKYVPNDIARSFASGSARAIAIAVNASDTRSYANRFFNNTVFAIETAAHRRGYNFIITSANDGRGGVGSLEKLILSKKIDGLVLPVSLLRSSIVKIVEDMSFPFVVLGRVKHAGGRLSWVDIANEQAGANAVRYLLGKGYRRIGFLTCGDKELFTCDRLDGYRAELSRSGLSPDPVYRVSPAAAFDETKLYLKTLFTSAAVPDAVICCDDKMALAALRGARELGRRGGVWRLRRRFCDDGCRRISVFCALTIPRSRKWRSFRSPRWTSIRSSLGGSPPKHCSGRWKSPTSARAGRRSRQR